MSSLMHVENTKKYIFIFGKGPTDRLDDTVLTTGKEYSINLAN